jgi:hypothetical protein
MDHILKKVRTQLGAREMAMAERELRHISDSPRLSLLVGGLAGTILTARI